MKASVLILCCACLLMDGFDVQAMGYVAPALIRDWNIPREVLGPALSAVLVGVLVGSLGMGMLADRFGRRPVLIAGCLWFSVLTLATTQVATLNQLIACRFLAGVGLGGIMPNAVALVGEFSPEKLRVTIMMNVANGFTIGAAFGGFVAAWIIPMYGWRGVFYFGGVVPLVIAVCMYLWLPESEQYKSAKPAGVPLVRLFEGGRGAGTLLLWTANFMNLLNLYFLSNWLPTLVRDLGFSNQTAVLAGTTLQVGGSIGAICLGPVVARLGFFWVLRGCSLLACASIAMIGYPGLSLFLLFTTIFLAGFGVPGGQAVINALSATFYPTELRSTGVGAGLGVGRIGSIVGPLIGAQLLSLHWSNQQLFLAAAVPAAVALLVAFAMQWVMPQAARAQ